MKKNNDNESSVHERIATLETMMQVFTSTFQKIEQHLSSIEKQLIEDRHKTLNKFKADILAHEEKNDKSICQIHDDMEKCKDKLKFFMWLSEYKIFSLVVLVIFFLAIDASSEMLVQFISKTVFK